MSQVGRRSKSHLGATACPPRHPLSLSLSYPSSTLPSPPWNAHRLYHYNLLDILQLPPSFSLSLAPSIDLATALSFPRYARQPELYGFLHHGPRRRPVCRALRARPFWQGTPCASETASQLDDNGVEEVTGCVLEPPHPTLHGIIECVKFADIL